ncbi:hypothetical protein F3J23_10775 [Chryseobacterium sp. Tr-659]|uniref:hypothetical protein n=1 Tax=Chryseobacterium sp. Tr-659 TaxID=2608340 RepID=UPI001420B137|nr:hypothetical protein [Chryseobacterium sp. Tr-659]NIF05924.1 hypothetical protein [Chryseobacterium sp. Tr-659]
MKSYKQNRKVIWIVIIGAVFSIVAPLLLPFLSLNYLKDYGTIGDAVGGIANPITQLVGFVLLFLALKAQIDSNKLIQDQIEAESRKEMLQRELTHLHQLYSFMENDIKSFNYENRFKDNGSTELLHGRRAIRCFIDDIENNNIDLHNTEQLLQEDGVREIMSILKIAELIFKKINHSGIEQDDRIFYLGIMRHELVFSIFPYTDLDESANLRLPVCKECGEHHGNYPPLIFDKLMELKQFFS